MKKKLKIGMIVGLILILCCSIVFANTEQELRNRQKDVQDKINSAKEQKNSIAVELSETSKKIAVLVAQISENTTTLEKLKSELGTLEKEIQEAENKLNDLQQKYDAQNESLKKRLVAMYEAGETTYLDVLLSSKSVTDFVTNYYLVSEIIRMDEELLDSIEKEKNEIAEIKADLDTKKQDLKQKEEAQQQIVITLSNAKIQKDSYKQGLNEQEQKIIKDIETYEQEKRDIEKEIQHVVYGNDVYDGGIFAWPAPGYHLISSKFGRRVDPFTGVPRGHAGIDICGTYGHTIYGANIVAAASGRVVTARHSNYGYGNCVFIDHGSHLLTIYGHGSELLVHEGQYVNKGDVIMKAGSSGRSTGPHLHFEVRKNNVPVNPLNYL